MSLFNDPFKSAKIKKVEIEIWNGKNPWATTNASIVAKAFFENGGTTGSQRFEGNDLTQLVREIQEFINSLG